jgi:two-component system sensor histidine kinase ChiS
MTDSTSLDSAMEGVILIVDDIPTNLEVLLDVLFDSGFEVLVALDGESAIEQVEYAQPDIILLDVMMPGIDGFETCRRLKKNPSTKNTPVIFMTALSDTVDKVKGFELGAVDYITKPLQHEEVLARVNTHLTLQKLQKQLKKANLELEQANSLLEKRVEERTIELVQVNASYERFLPSEFLAFLNKKSVIDVNLGDQVQQEMTILFSDICRFTTLSERMTPQENFNFINSYLKRVSPIIRQHHGFIDKYVGDGIMALFPRTPDDAIQAAIQIEKEVKRYNTHRQRVNYAPIRIKTSIHIGSLMLGIIGEEQRLQGTVISDAVNLASRLEGVSQIYEAGIVISAQTLQRLENPSQYNFRFVDKVQVKGKKEVVSVFEILDGTQETTKALKLLTRADFEEGLHLYYQRKFAEASVKFNRVLTKNPQDKAAQIHLRRAAHFMVHGVSPDWAGVETLTEK